MLCMEGLVDISHLQRPCFLSDILHLNIPSKLKNLVWQMCRRCLPTRVYLQDKCIQYPTNCVSCDSSVDDLDHVFFYLSFCNARLVYNWFIEQHSTYCQQNRYDLISNLFVVITSHGQTLQLIPLVCFRFYGRTAISKCGMMLHRRLLKQLTMTQLIILLEDWTHK